VVVWTFPSSAVVGIAMVIVLGLGVS